MTHPGLAVMLVVGVGLGAVLYYFFASTSEQMPNRRRESGRSQGPNNRTCWSSSPPTDPRNRRQDQKCTICIDEANKENGVRIVPCMHIFHKQCIEEWRKNGAGDARQSCPICRDKIMGLEEL
ncbi:hypothetical protein TSAR_005943 [Trichomalopsis sarcophagae]|uniref:RING-type domain-containing protein n=1 Tax=Trichomalopsis sarcophagae TaxID=543379 RepID=A0A232EZ59_9HYME|nr:hypothetical protein TSAR_005943 [Trichomalopsis sarcophagae]